MTFLITCTIDYDSDSVLCFDPLKVLGQLAASFPEAEIDRTDLAAAEVAWVHEYTDGNPAMPADHKEMMRRQIAGKQQRVGPAYRFRLSVAVTGHVNRYSLVFKTDDRFDDELAKRIRQFMSSLEAGHIRDAELDSP